MHGDTFDSGKLAHWALVSTTGGLASVAGIRMGPNFPNFDPPPRPVFFPHCLA